MIATIYSLNQRVAKNVSALVSDKEAALVAEGFRQRLPVPAGIERHLKGVVNDTLEHPGSLARAQLSYSLMMAFGFTSDESLNVGTAIEYFHTASLIFDDLPCMDNAVVRRGFACAHTTQGESAAILGALSLITQGYGLLWSALNARSSEQRLAASALVNECLGLNGILNGQSYDLNFAESDRSEDDVLRIAVGKTVTLIRLTLLLPALMHGVSDAARQTLESLAMSWGLAYQILDDFKDGLMSASETGKTTARDEQLNHPNLPRAMGAARAAQTLGDQLEQSRALITLLHEQLPGLSVLDRLQVMLEGDHAKVMMRLSESSFRGLSVPT